MSIEPLKDGIRSHVRIDFYGHVHKKLRGTGAAERYAKEVEVLKILEETNSKGKDGDNKTGF